jgi:rRNA processing protein Krr1/Pno1
MENEVQQAVAGFLRLVARGWDIETACLCMHDGVYDVIEVDEFITLCQNASIVKKQQLYN